MTSHDNILIAPNRDQPTLCYFNLETSLYMPHCNYDNKYIFTMLILKYECYS